MAHRHVKIENTGNPSLEKGYTKKGEGALLAPHFVVVWDLEEQKSSMGTQQA